MQKKIKTRALVIGILSAILFVYGLPFNIALGASSSPTPSSTPSPTPSPTIAYTGVCKPGEVICYDKAKGRYNCCRGDQCCPCDANWQCHCAACGTVPKPKPSPTNNPKPTPTPTKTPQPKRCDSDYDCAKDEHGRTNLEWNCTKSCSTSSHRCYDNGKKWCLDDRNYPCHKKNEPCSCSQLNPADCWYDAEGKIDPEKKCELTCNNRKKCVPSGKTYCADDPVNKCHDPYDPCYCLKDEDCHKDKNGKIDPQKQCERRCHPAKYTCADKENPKMEWCPSSKKCFEEGKSCCQDANWPRAPRGCATGIFGKSPSYGQHNCCNIRDFCYRRGGPEAQKQICDDELKRCLKSVTPGKSDKEWEDEFKKNFNKLLSGSISFREHKEDCTCNIVPTVSNFDNQLDGAKIIDDCCGSQSSAGCQDGCLVQLTGSGSSGWMQRYGCVHLPEPNTCAECPKQDHEPACLRITLEDVKKLASQAIVKGDINGDGIFDSKDLVELGEDFLEDEDLTCSDSCYVKIPSYSLPNNPVATCKHLQGAPKSPKRCFHIGILSPIWQSPTDDLCCYNHDICYQIGGTDKNRQACDKWFFDCLTAGGHWNEWHEIMFAKAEGTCIGTVITKTRKTRNLNYVFKRVFLENLQGLFGGAAFNYHLQSPCAKFTPNEGCGNFEKYWDNAIVTRQCQDPSAVNKLTYDYLELTVPKNKIPEDEWVEIRDGYQGAGWPVYMNAKGDLILNYHCGTLDDIAKSWGGYTDWPEMEVEVIDELRLAQ